MTMPMVRTVVRRPEEVDRFCRVNPSLTFGSHTADTTRIGMFGNKPITLSG